MSLEQATSELNRLLNTIPNRSEENQNFIELQKESFRNIDGELFPKTGFEELSSAELLNIIDQTYPGFKENFQEIFDTIVPVTINEFDSDVYSEKEILEVIEDWKKECAIRSLGQENFSKEEIIDSVKECRQQVENPIIPFTRQEIIKAACEKIIEELEVNPEAVIPGNPDIEDVIGVDTIEPELGVQELDNLLEAIKDPTDVIIIGNTLDTILEILVKVGDQISCATPLFRTESGIIPGGFDSGVVKEIFVTVGNSIQNTELIHINVLSKSKLEKSFAESKEQISEIQQAVALKEQQYQAEKNWYFLRLEEAWLSGRYESYEYYFSGFTEALQRRDTENQRLQDLTQEITDIENQINTLFQGYETTFGTGSLPLATRQNLRSLIDLRNAIYIQIQGAVSIINQANGEILQLRNEQYIFAATEADINAEITSETSIIDDSIFSVDIQGNPAPNGNFIVNPIFDGGTQVQFFIPSQETVNAYPSSRTLAKGVQQRIEEFTNELGINNTISRYMDDDDYSFSYNLSFTRFPIDIDGDDDDAWIEAEIISRDNRRDRLSGPFHNLRVGFYLFVTESSDTLKSTPAWNIEVKEKENLLRLNIDSAINNAENRIRDYSKQYGHIAIKLQDAFLEIPGTSTLDSFRISLENKRAERQAAEELVSTIRGGLESAEEKIQQLEETLNSIDNETCEYYKIYSTELRNDINFKLCIWPQATSLNGNGGSDGSENGVPLVNEEINYRSNPRSLEESPPITDLEWWKKFCNLATIFNLVPIYWPIGLLIPNPSGILKIPLPVIWRPIFVLQTPLALIVIGIAQAGVLPGPFVFVLNPNAFSLGPVSLNSCWFTGAVRPFKKIKNKPGSQILPIAPIVQIGLNKIDINPSATSLIPFIKDDLPPYERLSLNNILFLLFLNSWCSAGKKSQGFFTNP